VEAFAPFQHQRLERGQEVLHVIQRAFALGRRRDAVGHCAHDGQKDDGVHAARKDKLRATAGADLRHIPCSVTR
jgi:hypothetical protein